MELHLEQEGVDAGADSLSLSTHCPSPEIV